MRCSFAFPSLPAQHDGGQASIPSHDNDPTRPKSAMRHSVKEKRLRRLALSGFATILSAISGGGDGHELQETARTVTMPRIAESKGAFEKPGVRIQYTVSNTGRRDCTVKT